MAQHLHLQPPAFTRLYDSAGTLYQQGGPGELIPDRKTLAEYQADFEIEPLDLLNDMVVLQFFEPGK